MSERLPESLSETSGISKGITGHVAETGQAEIVNRVDLTDRGKVIPGTPVEPESLLCTPLKIKDQVIGVVTLNRLAERVFLEEDLIFLENLGNICATVIENARLYESLHESEESYRGLYDHASDAIYIQDRKGRFLDVNQGVVDMYGYPKEFFIGKTPEPLAAPNKNDMKQVAKYIEQAFEGKPQQFEFWGKRKNGEVFPKFVRLNKSRYFGKEVIIAFASDITERKQAEKTLKESEVKYKEIATSIPGVVYQFMIKKDGSYAFPYVDENCEKFFHHKAKAVMADPNLIFNMVPPDELQSFIDSIEKSARTLKEWRHNFRVVLPDGQERWFEGRSVPHLLPSGEPFWNGVVTDITERKWAEEEISFLANALKSISECVSITDEKDRLLFVNEAFLKTYGYTREEVVGHLIQEIVGSKQNPPEVAKEILPATILGGWQGELINRRKDKSEFPISLSTTPVRNDHGKIVALIGVAEDITERKQAEEALKVSEKKYRDAVENASDLIFMNDIHGNFTFLNTVSEKMTGYTKDELIGMNYAEITHPDDKEKTWELYEEQFKTRSKEIKFENRFVTKSGKIKWLWVHSTLLMEGDSVVGWQNIGRDITERKQAEKALKESEEKYRLLVDNTDTGFVIVDEFGVVVDANEPYCRLVGVKKLGEILGHSVIDWTAPECKEENAAAVERCGKQGYVQDFETIYIREDGQWVNIIINAIMHESDEGKRLHALCRDITQRKRAEEELRYSEERYRSILEKIEEGYYEVDLKGNFTFFNDSLFRMLNYSRDELMGMNNRQYMDSESADRIYKAFNEVFRTEKSSKAIEFKIKRKKGKINSGEISISLLKDRNNQPIGFRGIVRDITERIKAEEELKQKMEQINRANQLMVGRELKMIDLKREVNEQLTKAGKSKKYTSLDEVE